MDLARNDNELVMRMKKIFLALLFLLIAMTGCGEKSEENISENNEIDLLKEVVGNWKSAEDDEVVEIKYLETEEAYSISWHDEDIHTRFIEFNEKTNEFVLQSIDIKKWNIEFLLNIVDEDHMIIFSSNVEGEMLGITKPITYERIEK